ncbi:MAG: hypothetical protein A2148_11875 [Chloroflexi bacterium RBG_16_68_14]|nr:MAG: hypothetical protein A2148_11875 [Chloroflexi bacterium RBG_16_68_14]
MIPFLAAVAVFATILFFLLALTGTDTRMRTRLEALRGRSRVEAQEEQRLSLADRMLLPVAQVPAQLARWLMPTAMLDRIRVRLVLAGEPMTLNAFLTFQLVTTGTFLFLPLLLIAGGRLTLSPAMLLVLLGLVAVGFLFPSMWLRQRVTQRQAQIIKSLPDSFDLITTCVEAGLGLDASLARVAEKVEGPFAEELSRTLREIALGKMRRDALRELGERTGVPDLVTFVNAVIQAEQMGSSVGAVLRVQSEQLRVRRRQRAEAQAYRAPVKMIFPLVLCIFPTLFIVILGPAVITIMRDFPGLK